MRLSVVSWMHSPRDRWQQTDRVNRASLKIQNACYLWPYFAFIRIFRSPDTDFHALWSSRWNSICSGYARIRGPLWFVSRATDHRIEYPRIDGAASWEIYFTLSGGGGRGKLLFSTLKISTERRMNAPSFNLISVVRMRALLLYCQALNKTNKLYCAAEPADI